jgi:hypothetical protein
LKLSDHDLFSAEDLMSLQLEQMFDEYSYRQLVDLESFYNRRISSLTVAASDLRARLEYGTSASQTKAMRQELRQILERLVNARKVKDLEQGERIRLLGHVSFHINCLLNSCKLRRWSEDV